MTSDRGGTSAGISRRRAIQGLGTSGLVGLAGCSGTAVFGAPQTGGKTVVKFAANGTIKDAWSTLQPLLHEIGLPDDIDVEVVAGSWSSNKRRSEYQVWLSAEREKPDILLMDNGWTIPFISREQVLNLDDALPNSLVKRIKEEYFDAIVRTAIDEGSGDLFGVPLWIDLPTIQYRKDLVKQAGYQPDKNNWAQGIRWKKFADATKKVKEQNDLEYGFTFQAQSYEGLACCNFLEFMASWGGAYFGGWDTLFGPVGDRPVTVGEQPAVDSVRMIRTFINGSGDPHALDGYAGNIAPETVLQWSEEPSRKPFTDGDAVMHRNWPYSILENGSEEAFGEALGVMPIPYAVSAEEAQYENHGGPVAAVGGWNLTVNPYGRYKDAALEVIKAMAAPEFRFKLFEEAGYTPPNPKLLESDRAKDVSVMGRYLQQLKLAGENAIPRPVTVVWPQQSTAISSKVNGSYSGSIPPNEAMSTLNNQLVQIENYVGGN